MLTSVIFLPTRLDTAAHIVAALYHLPPYTDMVLPEHLRPSIYLAFTLNGFALSLEGRRGSWFIFTF